MSRLARRQRLDYAPRMPADPGEAAAARLRVVAAASVDRRLNDLDVRALALLAGRIDIGSGFVTMSTEHLAAELRIAARSAFRVLSRLDASGYLVGYRAPGRSTVYSIDWKRFSNTALTVESGVAGDRRWRIGRRAAWAFRLRQDPLPFPGVAPAEMDREQVVVAATFAVAHSIEFKRAIASARWGTRVCALGREILAAWAAGGKIAERRWRGVGSRSVDHLRDLLEHHESSVFKRQPGPAA